MARKDFQPQLRPTADRAAADISSLFEVDPGDVPALEPVPVPVSPVSASSSTTAAVVERATTAPQRKKRPASNSVGAEIPAAESAEEGGYVPIFTYLGAESEALMHRAAYTRSGEAAKSEIVREALDAVREQLESASVERREELLNQIRRADADDRSRTSRIYRINPAHKAWLHALAGSERVAMAATVRWAINSWLERESGQSDSAVPGASNSSA